MSKDLETTSKASFIFILLAVCNQYILPFSTACCGNYYTFFIHDFQLLKYKIYESKDLTRRNKYSLPHPLPPLFPFKAALKHFCFAHISQSDKILFISLAPPLRSVDFLRFPPIPLGSRSKEEQHGLLTAYTGPLVPFPPWDHCTRKL